MAGFWPLPRLTKRPAWISIPLAAVCRKNPTWPLLPANSALRPAPRVCGQALRYAGAWLRASWLSAISGASRPSASLGGGLRPAVALRAVLVLGSLRSPAGKKPFIAHFGGGARYVARIIVGQFMPTVVRARSSPFSAVKMGGPFSLRCLSPLCFGAVGCGQA